MSPKPVPAPTRPPALSPENGCLAELNPALLATADVSGRLTFASGAWERELGWTPADLVGCPIAELVHPDDLEPLRAALASLRAEGGEGSVGLRLHTRAGAWRWIDWRLRREGEHWYAAGHDASERRRAEQALAASESRFRALVEQVPAIVYTAGPGRQAVWKYVSPQIETMLGYSAEQWMASDQLWFASIHPDDRERVLADEAKVARPGGQLRSKYRMRRADGEWIWVRDDATAIVNADGELLFQGVLLDITEAKRAEQAVRDKHDQLQAIIDNSPLLIFAKDRDHRYLLANRETEELIPGGVIGRTDEAVLGPETAARMRADDSRVLEAGEAVEAEHVIEIRGRRRTYLVHKFPLRSSEGEVYGLCCIATDISGRKAREDALREKLEWSFRIRESIERDRLVLHAQPIVELGSGRVVQEELLLRMLPEAGGELIMPDDFLPAAERFGLVTAIDRWVVAKAARLACERPVQVNLSAQSLGDAELPAYIERQLRAAGADPSHLVFEITETAAAEDLVQARRLAELLTELGCGFALDDFGTGYGSFTYLKHLPVRYIKIDGEFVRELGAADANRQVVKAIVDVARTFGIETIAEGVESQQTLEALEQLGVDYAQGFHTGRPAWRPTDL